MLIQFEAQTDQAPFTFHTSNKIIVLELGLVYSYILTRTYNAMYNFTIFYIQNASKCFAKPKSEVKTA